MVINSSPFGSRSRTTVLLALRLMDGSHARELARVLSIPLTGVQQALRGLEKDGLVAATPAGRTRVYRINPRYFAIEALKGYLSRLVEPEEELRGCIEGMRRRPRKAGKPL